jgi:hypothetical protein
MNNKNQVSYEEQIEQGLIRPQRGQFVPPAPRMEVLPPMPQTPLSADVRFDLPASATQQTIVRTSGVDRARGFQIETRELGIVFGLGMVIVGYFVGDWPFLSLWTLTLFAVTYAITWAWAYYQHKHTSGEGVSLYEAKVKGEAVKTIVKAHTRQFELDREQARSERADLHNRRMGQ